MEKHGVDLDDEGQRRVGDVRLSGHCDGVAEDDHEMVHQQFVGRPLLVVDEHVEEVIDKISDGERDEDVNGRVETADHVGTEARVSVEGDRGPRAGDKRMYKGCQNISPFPS